MKLVHVHNILDIVNDINELASWPATSTDYADEPLSEEDSTAALQRLEDTVRICTDFGS